MCNVHGHHHRAERRAALDPVRKDLHLQVWRKALYEWDYKVVKRALESSVGWRAFLNPVPPGGSSLRLCTLGACDRWLREVNES
jgi:hypothetical protein